MRTAAINKALRELANSFSIKAPVIDRSPRELYHRADHAGMVKFVRDSMNLNLRVRVGLVDRGGGSHGPAWIETPVPMPVFGTAEFQSTLVTLFIRRTFWREAPFESVMVAIAHELSHVVLYATGHRLSRYEEAVDLTAMMLGYRTLYLNGIEYIAKRFPSPAETGAARLLSEIMSELSGEGRYALGYLSYDEVCYAAHQIESLKEKLR